MARDDYYFQTSAEALREIRDRQIVAAGRLNSLATFAGWFLGVLLVAQFIGGLVLIFRTGNDRVCLPGHPHICAQAPITHPYTALGIGLLASSVGAVLLVLVGVYLVKVYAISQEAAAYQLPS